jgi:hypothetical protein
MKYVQLITLPNKEAATVSSTIFNHWICHFGVPVDLITDQEKEFCTWLSEKLFKPIGTSHLRTNAGHPQTNCQAEVTNKTISKYLAYLVNETTLDREQYLYLLMFCNNTCVH